MFEQQDAAYRQAVSEFEALIAAEPRESTQRYYLAEALGYWGHTLLATGGLPAAEATLRRGLAVRQELIAKFPERIDTLDNLAWVQVCDLSGTPRELAGDADRILPGEGDFQIGPILDHLGRIGYEGYVSLEVLNPQLWRVAADRVADAGFQATCRTLGPRYRAEPWGGP